MRALVLAGGEGRRLRPLTLEVPKPLVPVGGRPVVETLVERLAAAGVGDVALNVHWLAARMEERLGGAASRLGASLTLIREPALTGTAGPLASAASFLRASGPGPFVVASGDGVHDVDLGAMIERHRASGAMATIGLMRIAHPERSALAELDGAGMLRRYVEKPPASEVFTDLASIGLYVFEPEVLDRVPSGRPCDMARELIPSLLAGGARVAGWEAEGYWNDVGTPADLLAANLWAARGAAVVVEPSVVEGRVEGPAVVGPYARVGPRAVVRDAVVLPGASVDAPVVGTIAGSGEEVWETWRRGA